MLARYPHPPPSSGPGKASLARSFVRRLRVGETRPGRIASPIGHASALLAPQPHSDAHDPRLGAQPPLHWTVASKTQSWPPPPLPPRPALPARLFASKTAPGPARTGGRPRGNWRGTRQAPHREIRNVQRLNVPGMPPTPTD
ncbi:hypothetical protein CDD83_1149 [Cordyceps sp. RAO-2017]|nr:hypothetical protein CDD83_1149 [Cordyceps sp. RAO-2017]